MVDVPKDITAQKTEYIYPKSISMRSYNPTMKGHPKQIKLAVDLLLDAKRPIIYTGGGVVTAGGENELYELVKLLNYPCTNTLMGLGAYPANDEQFVGMLGMHGTYEANMAMHDCDVMLAIGARFDDRVTGDLKKFSPDAQIIHIDIDPSSIGKNVPPKIPIVGDAKRVVAELVQAIKKSDKSPDAKALSEWWKQIEEWRSIDSLAYDKTSNVIKPQFVLEKLFEVTKGDAFVTSDVGQHQMWAAQHYRFDKTRRWVNSGGLGTMGFGLPAAMGVQFAYPDATVACVTGEASIIMCIQELSTCRQYDLPIKIINLNNRYMGMVRQWQEFFYNERYSHSYMDALPNFVDLAQSFGHKGMLIEKPGDVEGALREAMAMKDDLVFMDFITDAKENVYPMIAAGSGHNEMHLNPNGSNPLVRELA